jgi:transcriptional regulator with XRE-family HTH domain
MGYNFRVDISPRMQDACTKRDIAAIFRILLEGGMTQRDIAYLVKMSQSEVSEILKGRQVQSYDVLVRVADGLDIPRGLMGLAYTEGTEPDTDEEVDEEVERRKLLASAGLILFGVPVFGEPEPPLTVRHVIQQPPSKINTNDVEAYEHTVARLEVLDRETGGMAACTPLAATAEAGERLLTAEAVPDVLTRLRYAVSEAHRLTGWAYGDIGLTNQMRFHMHKALDFAAGSTERIAAVLCSSGAMEKHYGSPNDALKLFQLAEMGGNLGPGAQAVISGLSAMAYQKLGLPAEARQKIRKSRSLFKYSGKSQPFFDFYGPGYGLLAAGETKLGDYDIAREDVVSSLRTRPVFDIRCNALDTIVLATVNIQAGELRHGIPQARQALALVHKVGSSRVKDKLEPLELALTSRKDSTCQDLARVVQAVRVT